MWNEFLGNQILISAVLGWTVAQFLKTVIDMVINKSFNPERIFGSGGMPSSHSATVCALTTASGMKYGVGSFEFAISFVLSMIVMYDAMGVRRETGKQAKLLNSVFFENILNLDGVFLQEKLKEYVGHTPLQVVAGAVLGILLAVLTGKLYSIKRKLCTILTKKNDGNLQKYVKKSRNFYKGMLQFLATSLIICTGLFSDTRFFLCDISKPELRDGGAEVLQGSKEMRAI